MVTKEILIQYSDLQEEIKEVRDRIEKTENQIERIEREGAVCDKVMGGDGGLQPFKIEGFPYPEYSRKKTLLYARKATLTGLEMICNWLLLKMEKYVWECIIIAKKNGGLENKREKDGIQISIMLLHGNLFQNHTRRKRNAEKGQNKRSTAPEAGREHPATRN